MARFDDPRRRFQTLYLAADPDTAVLEVLAPLRPDLQTLAELAELFGAHSRAVRDAGMVARSDIADYELVRAIARSLKGGEFADLEDLDSRQDLERSVPALLAEHGVAHLDIGELRSARRSLTQTLAGVLFDEGFAGGAARRSTGRPSPGSFAS